MPFELTVGQQLAGATLTDHLAREHPMHRLLQGEVGSGKTVIALRAMLQVVDAAGQAVLLAPTEVLAQQHFRVDLQGARAAGHGRPVGGAEHATRLTLLTGSLGAAARRKALLLAAASGEAGIIIGTHALLQDRVQFADLGLVVIDEQQVRRRAADALRDKAEDGLRHMLVMTATPIPRTVAMTVFGDLDVSTLTKLPVGRWPIATHVVPVAERPHYLARTWARIREEVAGVIRRTSSARGLAVTGSADADESLVDRGTDDDDRVTGRPGHRSRCLISLPSLRPGRWPAPWPSCTVGCPPKRRRR